MGFALLLLASCGQLKSGLVNPVSAKPAPTPKQANQVTGVNSESLVGVWYTDCLPMNDQVGKYFKDTKVITTLKTGAASDHVLSTTSVFKDSGCQQPYYSYKTNASFSMATTKGKTTFNEAFYNVMVVANDNQVTQYFNAKLFCGQNLWVTGEAQMFSPVSICKFPVTSQTPLIMKNAKTAALTYCKGTPSICTQYTYQKLNQ